MYEFRHAKKHAIARTFHEAFQLVERCLLLALMVAVSLEAQQSVPPAPAWTGVVRTAAGEPVAGAKVTVFTSGAKKNPTAVTGTDGRFAMADIRLGPHNVSVQLPGRGPTVPVAVDIIGVAIVLTVSDQNELSFAANPQTPAAGVSNGNPSTTSNAASGTGGEKLSSQKVNELPLNGRDFSALLLLAAGTMTDVNGQTNFTQQFAINGQRGVEAVFAMDGADVSDPEMGGSTFTNFNVDAIQELQSSSGWMPADIGRGAAGFTNIVTRSGKNGFHGSFFEFLRNSALDARNYFDHPSIAEPGRIPPFRRNEFGFTNGGPVVLPHLYDGRDRTFYFVQYQGFRQVLGTTQVLAVPTAAERAGQDIVKYPDGSTDTLQVPVNPAIAAVLARYPLPNHPTGAYGARTYAAPSNVNTDTDQFSVRIDQKVGAKGQLFSRFNYDNLTGPTTNPDQTLLDPSFGVQYVDRQRNGVITYTRTVSPRFLWATSLSFTRTTPSFVNRNDVNAYVEDTWKINPHWTLEYGLRYEIYTPISERAHRTSSFLNSFPPVGVGQEYLINPQPTYQTNWNGWGPRVQVDWNAPHAVHVHMGGAITVIPPNIWQDNLLTGSTPYVVYPRVNAAQNGEISYGFQITPDELPQVYNTAGVNVLASGDPKRVPANTVMDVNRYQQDLAALAPSHQLSLLSLSGIDRRFGNGYLQTWTLGLERAFGGLTADVAYVGTSAFRLPRMSYPNAYPGADSEFARFTNFDGSGATTGGFGFESVVTGTSHSSYNALQTSLSGNVGHGGPSLQAGYTWGKSLDDVSGIIGGTGSTEAVTLFSPQNPFDTQAERGPSSFDVTHAFTLSAAQDLHFEHLGLQSDRTHLLTEGWELLSISTITSGSPFTVYSGIQQTGAGTIGADRPDQIGTPDLSSAGSSMRPRDDYFGRGAHNASFFSIPTGIAGGTGPNSGRFGTLGRNTFRGPAYYDFEFALIKTTPIGHRESGLERADLQFRAELFNLFNIANMGLPANLIAGTGFGMISKTAGTSRQIQFSLKLIY